MRHHSGSDRSRRVVIALVVVSSLVAVFAGVQLVRGDDKAVASSPPERDRAGSLNLGPDPSFKDTDSGEDQPASDPSLTVPGANPLLGSPGYYANPRGPARRLRVTLSVKSDGPIYVAYDFRDGKRGGPRVVGNTFTVTHTLRGPFPITRLGAQVMVNATYVTCRVTVDGEVLAEDTARKPGYIAACLA